MSTIIAEVYEAFKAAGVSDEQAKSASQAIADYEMRFSKIDTELAVLKWMVGLSIILNVSILMKLFSIF